MVYGLLLGFNDSWYFSYLRGVSCLKTGFSKNYFMVPFIILAVEGPLSVKFEKSCNLLTFKKFWIFFYKFLFPCHFLF